MLVTIRPPADEAHCHNPEAESLFTNVVQLPGESRTYDGHPAKDHRSAA